MRFLITVDQEWQVTITCKELGDRISLSRSMKLSENRIFPLPSPEEEDFPLPEESHYKLCLGDESMLKYDRNSIENLMNNRMSPLDKELPKRFGRYLFDALIGRHNWTVIEDNAGGGDLIELALSWPFDKKELNNLPWEMLVNPKTDRFLAADKIAITRVVAKTSEFAPRELNFPPKVLFVTAGENFMHSDIRAGAEYMGLLRQIKVNDRGVHPRELRSTTADRLGEVMKSFEPDVVFFACHGDVDGNNRGFLELKESANDNIGNNNHQLYADQLKLKLKPTPPIVVLNACYTAPLAAELVKESIPIVIGMVGSVSDTACRLFTRRFGEALLQDESIVTATAEGRLAAWVGQEPSSCDWARPTIFLSEKVDHNYKVIFKAKERAEKINQFIKGYAVEGSQKQPVFVGRDEFFDAFHEMLDKNPKNAADNFKPDVLVITTSNPGEGFGRSRLLKEFTMRALREGHIPCPMIVSSPAYEGPKNILKLGETILKAMYEAKKGLNLQEWGNYSKMDELLRGSKNAEGIEGIINEEEKVQSAIREDLFSLKEAACKQHPTVFTEEESKILIFLDDLDKYDGPVIGHLLNMLRGNGFGKPKEPVPVVLVYSHSKATDKYFITEDIGGTIITELDLEIFKKDNEEDWLAYELVLMHPRKGCIMPKISGFAWVMDYFASDDMISHIKSFFRDNVNECKPDAFSGPNFWCSASYAVGKGFLVMANDDELMKNIIKRRNSKADGTIV